MNRGKFVHGWLPWRKGRATITPAVRYEDGEVYRLGLGCVLYKVSPGLAAKFRETVSK